MFYSFFVGKEGLTNEVPQKGVGPFTKEQNIKIANEQAKLTATSKKEFTDKFSKTHLVSKKKNLTINSKLDKKKALKYRQPKYFFFSLFLHNLSYSTNSALSVIIPKQIDANHF